MSRKISLFLILTSCGPIKGYEGPDLPREQLGLIKLGTSKCDKCRIEDAQAGSTTFFSRGVLLIPGKYFLQTKVVTWGEPYNCHTESYYDSGAYSLCQSDRERARKKEQSFYRDCSAEAYKTETVCSRNFRESLCSGGVDVTENINWEVLAETTSPEDEKEPGDASLIVRPTFSAEKEMELTKLHTLEKPSIPENQNISACKVVNSGVW